MGRDTPSAAAPPETPDTERAPEPYDPPAVVWEEPYDPVGLTVSCAKWEGIPACESLYLT
ncbi:MAG: hypothetical protein HY906_21310 [Deltaproteobacteria bacterium]|nr:hypothetical protein [Deltaproteobacteria bacterium]